jgi:hypothetical protein
MQGVVELLTAARSLTEATEADPTRGPRRFPHPFALFIFVCALQIINAIFLFYIPNNYLLTVHDGVEYDI